MTTMMTPAAAPKISSHIGVVGNRIRIDGVVRKMVGYGPVLHIIHDIDGNEFTLRTRKALVSRPGVLVRIDANVAAHGVYNEIKRTDLTGSTSHIIGDDHEFLTAKREG